MTRSEYPRSVAVMVDSLHPNASVIPTKADQLIAVTTQAGVTTQDKRPRLGITSSTDGPHSPQLGYIERLLGQGLVA